MFLAVSTLKTKGVVWTGYPKLLPFSPRPLNLTSSVFCALPTVLLAPGPWSWLSASVPPLGFCLDFSFVWPSWVTWPSLLPSSCPPSFLVLLNRPTGWGHTWMSQGPSQDTDNDEINLAITFQGLRITVAGPPERALDFVHRLDPEYQRPSGASSSQASQSEAAYQHQPQDSAVCPASVLALATKLSAASILTPEERVRRAWKAGLVTRAALEGRTLALDIGPIDLSLKYFVEVRGEGLQEPRITRSPQEFNRFIAGPRALGRGFPSETEATVYLDAITRRYDRSSAKMVELDHALPLHSDYVPAGFQPYALNLKEAGLDADGEDFPSLALLVMTRREGVMLAVPELALRSEEIEAGSIPGSQGLVGPSQKVEVCAAAMDEDALQQHPVPLEGTVLTVLLVDFTLDILAFLKPVEEKEEFEQLHGFDPSDVYHVPAVEELVDKALAWALGGVDTGERHQFYSADEVPETPTTPQRRTSRRKEPPSGEPKSPKAASKKKPTMAQLAESMEMLTGALPALTQQLESLSERTAAIEARGAQPPSRQSALRMPLASSLTPGLSPTSNVASLVKAMPPPRSMSTSSKPHVTFQEGETQEMSEDLLGSQPDLARAMMEQSRALTALVATIASNTSDPMMDLGSQGSSMSSKGAAGRAKLQAELAMHRGSFFVAVLQQMARRMQPALPVDSEMSTLRDRGITPSQYMERFGGYGKSRDIGFIAWQLSLAMNHMQEDNFLAAKDAIALLFVCLEQTAMDGDGGNMQVGLLLSLTEDPPQSVFTGRSLASTANPKPFAPQLTNVGSPQPCSISRSWMWSQLEEPKQQEERPQQGQAARINQTQSSTLRQRRNPRARARARNPAANRKQRRSSERWRPSAWWDNLLSNHLSFTTSMDLGFSHSLCFIFGFDFPHPAQWYLPCYRRLPDTCSCTWAFHQAVGPQVELKEMEECEMCMPWWNQSRHLIVRRRGA